MADLINPELFYLKEEVLEKLYWEWDRLKTKDSSRLAFKNLIRSVLTEDRNKLERFLK